MRHSDTGQLIFREFPLGQICGYGGEPASGQCNRIVTIANGGPGIRMSVSLTHPKDAEIQIFIRVDHVAGLSSVSSAIGRGLVLNPVASSVTDNSHNSLS